MRTARAQKGLSAIEAIVAVAIGAVAIALIGAAWAVSTRDVEATGFKTKMIVMRDAVHQIYGHQPNYDTLTVDMVRNYLPQSFMDTAGRVAVASERLVFAVEGDGSSPKSRFGFIYTPTATPVGRETCKRITQEMWDTVDYILMGAVPMKGVHGGVTYTTTSANRAQEIAIKCTAATTIKLMFT